MNFLKKQGVAWCITIVMIIAAIGIGLARSHTASIPAVPPDSNLTEDLGQPATVYDEADVISGKVEREIGDINAALLDQFNTMIAVVTVNENARDLGAFALDYADRIGLGAYDFIIVLDISGDNYWLVQGAGLVDSFTDADCSDYAWTYMEGAFAAGDYESAALDLVNALSQWCFDYYQQ